MEGDSLKRSQDCQASGVRFVWLLLLLPFLPVEFDV